MRLKVAGTAALLTFTVTAETKPAVADGTRTTTPASPGTEHHSEHGARRGNKLISHVHFSGATGDDATRHAQRNNGRGGALGSPNFDPPACWYEPAYTPEEMKKLYKNGKLNYTAQSHSAIPMQHWWGDYRVKQLDDLYGKDGKYQGFKKTKKGEGMFWAGVVNPKKADDPASMDCTKNPFWVPKGKSPDDVPLAVTPRILAEAAWGAIRIPGLHLKLNPSGRSTVNLATWAWTDRTRIRPLTATASLPEYGLKATTTAVPAQLTLDPGTTEADLHPASGVCPADTRGRIGAVYHKGDHSTPPCGVTYRHASTNGPYRMKATVTWHATWTGTGGAHGDLADGTFGSSQDVTVQEVQNVDAGSR